MNRNNQIIRFVVFVVTLLCCKVKADDDNENFALNGTNVSDLTLRQSGRPNSFQQRLPLRDSQFGQFSSSPLGFQNGAAFPNTNLLLNQRFQGNQFSSLGFPNQLGIQATPNSQLALQNSIFGFSNSPLNNGQPSSFAFQNPFLASSSSQFGLQNSQQGSILPTNQILLQGGQFDSSLGQLGVQSSLGHQRLPLTGSSLNSQLTSSLSNPLGSAQFGLQNNPFGSSFGVSDPLNQQNLLFGQNNGFRQPFGTFSSFDSNGRPFRNNVFGLHDRNNGLSSFPNGIQSQFGNDFTNTRPTSPFATQFSSLANQQQLANFGANSNFPSNGVHPLFNGISNDNPLFIQRNPFLNEQSQFPFSGMNSNTFPNRQNLMIPISKGQGSNQEQSIPIPDTGFNCDGRKPGYYADVKAGCRIFHICAIDALGTQSKNTFPCPNGTLFNQASSVCQWWADVDCSKSSLFYPSNSNSDQSTENPLFGFQIPSPLDRPSTTPLPLAPSFNVHDPAKGSAQSSSRLPPNGSLDQDNQLKGKFPTLPRFRTTLRPTSLFAK